MVTPDTSADSRLNLPTPSLVVRVPRAVIGQPAGHVAEGIEPAALLWFPHGIEIDDCTPTDTPIAQRVDRRVDDADGNLAPART